MPKGQAQDARTTVIDELMSVLFALLHDECNVQTEATPTKEGFSFEDHVSQRAYQQIRKYPITVLPPRSTLNYPTVSTLRHQFDVTEVNENTFFVVECKKRGTTLIDQVFSFNSKILDYALEDRFADHFGIKGIFLSTAEMNDNIRKYAFAYGMIPIDPTFPPIQSMINHTNESDEFRQELIGRPIFKYRISSPQ
jgi:hypothetical protein